MFHYVLLVLFLVHSSWALDLNGTAISATRLESGSGYDMVINAAADHNIWFLYDQTPVASINITGVYGIELANGSSNTSSITQILGGCCGDVAFVVDATYATTLMVDNVVRAQVDGAGLFCADEFATAGALSIDQWLRQSNPGGGTVMEFASDSESVWGDRALNNVNNLAAAAGFLEIDAGTVVRLLVTGAALPTDSLTLSTTESTVARIRTGYVYGSASPEFLVGAASGQQLRMMRGGSTGVTISSAGVLTSGANTTWDLSNGAPAIRFPWVDYTAVPSVTDANALLTARMFRVGDNVMLFLTAMAYTTSVTVTQVQWDLTLPSAAWAEATFYFSASSFIWVPVRTSTAGTIRGGGLHGSSTGTALTLRLVYDVSGVSIGTGVAITVDTAVLEWATN